MTERATYIDSSAIVKLVVREDESDALRAHIAHGRVLVSSAIAVTEVLRATAHHGEEAVGIAREVLARLELLAVDDDILEAAGSLEPVGLRSLDAIHLASARALRSSIDEFLCYDGRLAAAAADGHFLVVRPGRP
ncbi:MAG: type II toxin-antitoxin system VapC family toxin [Acidimicrobiales bacterium]